MNPPAPLDPSMSPITPRRRWARISLRGLMVVVVLIGGGAGWLANTIRTQRLAIEAVKAAGGTIRFDYQEQQVGTSRGRPVYRNEPIAPNWARRWLGDELFQNVKQVTFPKSISPLLLASLAKFDHLEFLSLADATGIDDGFRQLLGSSQLHRLNIAPAGVTDAMLEDIAQIVSIRKLRIIKMFSTGSPSSTAKSPATDGGFARLAALPNLEELAIVDYCPNLTDSGTSRMVEGMPHLQDLFLNSGLGSLSATIPMLARHHPELRSLGLDSSGVTDDDLKAIEGMTKLQSITLQKARIADAGLAHLRPLTGLNKLMLNLTDVTDEGLQSLSELTELKQLYLSGTKVTDAGLVHLERLANLKRLELGRTLVTDAGMPSLARITSLEFLGLSYLPNLTDAGLIPLQSLKNLQQLDRSGTPQITTEGIAALQKAVPSLTRVTNRPRAAPAAK